MKLSKRLTFFKFCLLFGITVFLMNACSKSDNPPAPPATDKSALQKVIDSANWYLTNTAEGTKPGNYTVGSKTARNSSASRFV